MSEHSERASVAPQLSRVRTFLFWALAFVWFTEMALWGFQSLSKMWTYVWNILPPDNPQLATAMFITQAFEAPVKGALGVLAVFGLRSGNPTARTALFISMAVVPPLNIAFPMRQQGFPLGSIVVATILSTILWGSFFLFRDPPQQPEQQGKTGSILLPPSRWEIFQYVWFAANSAALTLMAFFILLWPGPALSFIFPGLSTLLKTFQGELSSLIRSSLGIGTHLLALATASWIATAFCRSNPTLRQAVTVASALHAGLFCLWPLRRLALEFGGNSAVISLLALFVSLFVGWVLYAALSYRVEHNRRQEARP